MKVLPIYLTIILTASAVQADIFTFYSISANDPSGIAQDVGEAQLFMEVSMIAPGTASIVFTNTGPTASSLSEIYFDAPDLAPPLNLEVSQIINGAGVDFSNPDMDKIKPVNLPGANNLLMAFAADLGVDAGNPSPAKGVNPNEYLALELTFDTSYDLIDLLEAGQLKVGLHVISIGPYSESFVNNIPEPASLTLIGFIVTAITFVRRRLV